MFTALSIFAGLLLIGCSWLIYSKIRVSEKLWKTVPRERNIGVVMAFVALTYAAYHGRYMLEGGLVGYRPYVWVLLPVVTVLVYFFLDFVFARALGGILVVGAIYFTHEAFVSHLELRPLFSLNCYILGTIGLFLIGMPWILRDFFSHVRDNRTIALGSVVALGVSALLFIISPIL